MNISVMTMLRNKAEILEEIAADPDMMAILTIIRDLDLKDSWLAAGAVRNFIWNILTGKSGFDRDTDVDVVFYDPTVTYEETVVLEQSLRQRYPQYRWELKNQVYMHIHSPQTEPYTSSQDAVSKYPETCMALAVRLLPDQQLELFAPYGLADVLDFQVRPTPHFAKNPERMQVYRDRLAKKNWQEKWERLTIIQNEGE